MEKITVKEVRHVLERIAAGGHEERLLKEKTDEELLETNLIDEFSFSSLDFEEMLCIFSLEYRITAERSAMEKSSFRNNPTVENFIKIMNDYGFCF